MQNEKSAANDGIEGGARGDPSNASEVVVRAFKTCHETNEANVNEQGTETIERAGQDDAPTIKKQRRGRFDACEIPIDRITPDPDQPRSEFDQDAIERLAMSLLSIGLIQPITVREGERPFHYIIVTGERRWRAAKLAGFPTLSSVIIDGPRAESRRLETQVVENALREDLSPIEEARAFQTLMARNGWSARKLAEMLHLSASTISRSMSLLELPAEIQDDVDSGRVTPNAARKTARRDEPVNHPSPAPAASSPSTYGHRIFETSVGRVIVEGDDICDPFMIATALTDVSEIIRVEMAAINSAFGAA